MGTIRPSLTMAVPEPGPQAEEEHAPALVAAQSLHGRVIDELDRKPECRAEVEAHPAATEVHRLGDQSPPHHRRPGTPSVTAS